MDKLKEKKFPNPYGALPKEDPTHEELPKGMVTDIFKRVEEELNS